MRKFGLFLCLSLLFAFTGCSDSDDVEEQGGTVLAKPSVTVTTTTSSSFKVAWDAVPNAESYKYRLSQENETGDELVVQPENSTSATALAFGDLDPKTKYILRVKAVAAAGSGLTDSEYSKIFATTLAEEAAELTFEKIAATNPTYESVDVEIVPSAENLYYWQVVENSLIEGKSDREIVAALKENISELFSGTIKKTVYGLKADTEYTVVAFGYDLDAGKSTSAVARLETAFTTPADDRMTIAITVGEVADNNVHVTFEPSVADGHYFADVVAAKDIEGKTDMEIVALLQTKYGSEMTDIVRSGKFETDITVEENTNYTAVAFGYNVAASDFLTQLFRADIKNGGPEPGVSEAWVNMVCVYGTLPSGSPGVGTELMPSSDTKTIKVIAYKLQKSAGSLDEVGMTEESLRKDIISGGEVVTELEEGGYQAVYQTTYSQVWLFASIGIDEAGNAGEANWMIVQAQASEGAKPSILGVSDKNDETGGGDQPEVSDAWAHMTPSYEKSTTGDYAIFVEFYPNDKTEAIRVGAWTFTGTGDPTTLEDFGFTENSLRASTLGKSGVDLKEDQDYIGLPTDPNTIWLFSNVAKTSEGEPGKVNWIIVKIPATTSGELTILGQHADNDTGGGIALKDASFSDYVGEWTLESAGRYILSKNASDQILVSSSAEPVTLDVRIEQNEADKSYKVYGWSTDTEFANAHPFVMDFNGTKDPDLEISGLVNIKLAQEVYKEGTVSWYLCPRFVASSIYSFTTQNLSTFYGVMESSGAVFVLGYQAKYGDETIEFSASSYIGFDSSNPQQGIFRDTENIHAAAPYILVKKGSSVAMSAVKRMQIGRKAANISRVVTTHQNFARLSTASAIDGSFTNLMKQSMQRELAPIPVRKVTAGNCYSLHTCYSR